MGFIELEELVGKAWHRWAGDAPSYPHHPAAEVRLEELRGALPVFFRSLGGARAVRLASGTEEASRHRLTLRQRLGLGREEPMPRADLNAERLLLPETIGYFEGRELNRRLYFWLAAWLAHARAPGKRPPDPLQADMMFLSGARDTTERVLRDWPGLRRLHEQLGSALREARPARELPPWESAVEETVLRLLGGPRPASGEGRAVWSALCGDACDPLTAPRGYSPFLPVPLWGQVSDVTRSPADRRDASEPGQGGDDAPASERRLKARRMPDDQVNRRDPLILNRFEYLLSIAEMLNLNRMVEDAEEGQAGKAAESLDELSIGQTTKRAASRLKAELELAPPAVDEAALCGEHTYPEWDFTRGEYLDHHCRVVTSVAVQKESGKGHWRPDSGARKRIRAVKRQFEALRPRHRLCPAQADGDDLDLNALIRTRADLAATGAASDRLYLQSRNVLRDFAVTVLFDASLSTDAWVDNRRILDIEKEAVLALSMGLQACGDDHCVLAFSSQTRRQVRVEVLRSFDERSTERLVRRLGALEPGHYTRIGAALRHAAAGLEQRANRHRLLLLLTDGKPNDADHYEGRFGVEDTRRAVQEARRAGLLVFGITVDSKAREYFPYLFGPGGYAVVSRPARLPSALPLLYRQITA